MYIIITETCNTCMVDMLPEDIQDTFLIQPSVRYREVVRHIRFVNDVLCHSYKFWDVLKPSNIFKWTDKESKVKKIPKCIST